MNNLPEKPTPHFPYTKPTGGTRKIPILPTIPMVVKMIAEFGILKRKV